MRTHRSPLTRAARRAFTLVELMVVIVIIGILATLVVVNVAGADDDAKVSAAKVGVSQIGEAVKMFRIRTGALPVSLVELVEGPGSGDSDTTWHPLLDKVPKDPWDNDYEYEVTNEDIDEFEIVCYGKDGEPGGTEYSKDITYPERDED